MFLQDVLGIDIYDSGFSLYSKLGVEIVYLYFQFPLMVLIMAPAIDGLRQDWREASENMGASTFQFWRYVALPILTPAILGTMILLFGNSFGAQATAYQLTGGQLNLVPLLIGRQMSGDVLHNTGLGLRPGDGHGRDHGRHDPGLPVAPATGGALVPMKSTPAPVGPRLRHRRRCTSSCRSSARSSSRWATRRAPARSPPSLRYYENVLNDAAVLEQPRLLVRRSASSRSSSASRLILPTAFWVRLKVPRARPVVEFITLLPFVIPPIVLVFGLLRTFNKPPLPLTSRRPGSDILLIAAYTILSFPYMYRAVDTGLRSIDVQSLAEASQSLGAGWVRTFWQVILPNLRVALLSGAFLTLAIVVGEFTIANFLARPAFGPYLQPASAATRPTNPRRSRSSASD